MIQLVNILLSALAGIIEAVVDVFVGGIISLVPARRNTEFNADFLPVGKKLSGSENGFCLTGNRSLTIHDSYSNCLVLGGSGAGKSASILIPCILKMAAHSSLVIHDPSGELLEKTSGAVIALGGDVKILNYSKPEVSEKYNSLERAQSISDTKKISKLVVHSSFGQSKDPFWNTSAEALISLFAGYLLNYAPKQFCNLYNVLHLINVFSSNPEKTDVLFIRTKDQILISEYKAWVAYGDKVLMSIIATARAALSVFSDPSVAMVTSSDTINFESFRKTRTVLYINNSIKDMRYYSVISAIFFEQFFGEIMSKTQKSGELPIFFLLDESSSLYLGNTLPVAISNIRKSGSGILQVYQSYSQISDMYGAPQARNITANSYSKVYLSGQPIEVAQELEAIFGKYEYTDETDKQRVRPLMTADEIRQTSKSVILCGNHAPILTKMVPYYHQPKLKRLSEIPPVIRSKAEVLSAPPLIQFDSK